MEKNYDEDIMCLPDRYDTGLDIWRSGMAVSSGENDRKYDFIFGKETEKRKLIRKSMTAGGVLWIIVAILSFGIPFAGLRVAQNIHPLICFFLESFWCYQIFAAKSLSEESKKGVLLFKEK